MAPASYPGSVGYRDGGYGRVEERDGGVAVGEETVLDPADLVRVAQTSVAGHSVLVVPVPALETYVLERTRHYDDSFVSADPTFVHAHITLLAPFLSSPTTDDLERAGKIAAAAAAFDFVLDDVRLFAGGTIYLHPEPAGPFAALTAELSAAFPQCPPYDGLFEPVPHLTVDHIAGGVDVDATRASLAPFLPARCRADRVSLQWYANHGCRTVAEWPLGGPEAQGEEADIACIT